MTISTQPYKGARDFYPEDMRIQKYMFKVIRSVCEKFGYEEYDAPILEPTELYLNKGNEEIIREQTYTFVDRGGRSVTMRTEMTPTVTRMVSARRQELSYPLRWYSIPQCWRYERMQRGRGREFYQLNVDIFGVEGIEADLEIVRVADSIMQAYGAKRDMYTIKLASRKLTDYVLKHYTGLGDVEALTVLRLIDKRDKMDPAEFAAAVEGAVAPSLREAGSVDKLLDVLAVKSFQDLPEEIKSRPEALSLLRLTELLKSAGVSNAVYDSSLVRGFDYYNDIVFEVFDNHPDNNRAMYGGGRYDGLSKLFIDESIPVTGFAMGDIPLLNFLTSHELLPKPKVETEVCVLVIGDVLDDALDVVGKLRKMGVRAAVGDSSKKPDKQLQWAIKTNARFALFIGQQELDSRHFTLKDLRKNEEDKLSLERVVTAIKDYRK